MFSSQFKHKNMIHALALVVVMVTVAGCSVYDFFTRKRSGAEDSESAGFEVLGDDLGPKAGGRNEGALAAVYAVSADKAPAAVRTDPDLLARRLLKQFRSDGTTMARVVGRVENYRELLGGASADFLTAPATTYDATSVLATIKVAEEVCRALVAPTSWEHPGWSSILPNPLADVRNNLVFLQQRVTGVSTSKIPSSKIDALQTLLNNANSDNILDGNDYVAPCTAVVVDAQAMLM